MPSPFPLASVKSQALDEIQGLLGRFPDITPLLFQPGEYLIREGDAAQDVFIVLQGTLVVEQESMLVDSPPTPLATLTCEVESFAVIGEMAYLGDQVRAASVKAVTATHTLRLLPAHLDAVMGSCPMLTRVLCQQFAQRLREANRTIKEYQAMQDL